MFPVLDVFTALAPLLAGHPDHPHTQAAQATVNAAAAAAAAPVSTDPSAEIAQLKSQVAALTQAIQLMVAARKAAGQ